MNRIVVAACFLMLVACDTGEPASPSLGPVWSPGPPPAPYMPKVDEKEVIKLPTSMLRLSDAGQDAPSDNGSDAGDASTPACECGMTVVGHCLFNMATACQEYFSDHSFECSNLEVHPMGGRWGSGPCGGDDGTDLHRSSGGCMNECGSIHWSYRLGGGPPTEETKEAIKGMCEDAGLTYIPTGF